MKKRNLLITWTLVLLLALSTVTVSGAMPGTTKSVKDGRMRITLTVMSNASIKVSWSKQKKYTHYEIYRKNAGEKSYKRIASVKGTDRIDKRLKQNTLYKYKIRPYRYIKGKKSYGKYSYENAAATGVRVKDYVLELSLPENDATGVGVNVGTTDCSANQKTALIYRSTSVNGTYEKIKALTFKKSWQFWDSTYAERFIDRTVNSDTTYYYKFKVQKKVNKKTYSSKFSEPKAVRTQPNWTMNKLTYSNLTDEKTRQEINGILRKAGIRQSYVDALMALVKDYNEVVGQQPYFHNGFTVADDRGIDYEAADTYNLWTEKRSYADVNCRLTAMTLFRDFITTEKEMEEDDFLSTDKDAMENYPLCDIEGEDQRKFYTVYHPVSIGDTTNPEVILAAIQQEWRDRGIQFKEGDASLISVVCHDEIDNIAFVGHAGVMIEDGDDIYFIEKFGPTSPYQVAKFQGEEQVREYLLNRFWKFYTPGVSAPPVIMVNDRELSN